LMQRFGRRPAIASCAFMFVLGPIVMACSTEYLFLSFGRFITGCGIGSSSVVTPAYLGEMAPAERRGAIVSLYEVMLCVGMMVSGLVDLACAGLPEAWRFMVIMPAIPGALMGTALFALPESPRWLMAQRDTDQAFETITRLRHNTLAGETPRSKEARNSERDELELLNLWTEVEHELADQAAAQEMLRQRRLAGKSGTTSPDSPSEESKDVQYDNLAQGTGGAIEMVEMEMDPAPSTPQSVGQQEREPEDPITVTCLGCRTSKKLCWSQTARLMWDSVKVLWIGDENRAFRFALAFGCFNQLCASSSIMNYAPLVLKEVGIESNGHAMLLSSAMGGVKLLGVLCFMFIVDLYGRRTVLIVGGFGMGIAMVFLCIAIAIKSWLLVVISMLVYIMLFASSWASGFWVIVSEIFSMQNKSAACSTATAVLFLAGAVADTTFITCQQLFGSGAFLIFGAVAVLGAIYVSVTLPETMGKSLAEIQALMAPDQGSKEPWYRRIEIPFYGRCYETLEEEDGDSGNQPQPEGSVTPQIHTSA